MSILSRMRRKYSSTLQLEDMWTDIYYALGIRTGAPNKRKIWIKFDGVSFISGGKQSFIASVELLPEFYRIWKYGSLGRAQLAYSAGRNGL